MPEHPFFPHDQIRAGQDILLQDLEKAFEEKKILLAHAPTGLGKTAVSLSAAIKLGLKEKKIVFFLTSRHTQHRLAVETIKMIQKKTGQSLPCLDLVGKRWMCNQEVKGLFKHEFNEYCKAVVEKGECEFYNRVHGKNTITVEARRIIEQMEHGGPWHNEEVVAQSREQGMCGYEVSLELAKKAKVVIGDYNYIFNDFIANTILGKLQIDLENIILIVDEGHNLPDRIRDMLSNALTSFMVKNAISEAHKFQYQGLAGWLQAVLRLLEELARFPDESREREVKKEEVIEKINGILEYETLREELDQAAKEVREKQKKSFLGGISSFLHAWKGEDQGFVRSISSQESKYGPFVSLNYDCLDPSIATADIFKRVYAAVIMSGTLKPTSMYRDILGIEQGLERSYLSPFPPENKMTLIVPETTTKFTSRNESMFQQIGQKCSELAKMIPGNVAFFFPSYVVRDQATRFFHTEKKIFTEKAEMSKEEKEIFLNGFKAEKERGGVLLGVAGANFAEGIDLPGDLLNGVIVVGLPLGKPDLKTKALIEYYQSKFSRGWDYGYIFPAMSKCIQSAGRCIRSETDKGAVIFLDERFAWERYYACFPDKVGLIVTKEYGKVLKEFFGRR